MSSITNVMRLLNNVITGECPEYIPRSSSEVIALLGGLKSREEVYLSHHRRMKGVTNHELKRMYDFVAASIVMVTDITNELMELASIDSRVKSSHVYEALGILYLAFGSFQRLAGKVETLPQPEIDRCFGYVGGCCNYSILFQKLLYPEDECDHLEIYAEALGHDFQFCFKIDTDQDYSSPGSFLTNGLEKTLRACIPPANQIPVKCHLTAQPGKPVCPQFYRNPYFYGPRNLRNQNHASNRDYFRMKEDRERGVYRTKAATTNDVSYDHGGKVVKRTQSTGKTSTEAATDARSRGAIWVNIHSIMRKGKIWAFCDEI
ncbi:hypothetical protein BCIN_06g03050 [Botrytis cinerea B05.10]|uniref:Uncharacterized protein n=1 Tax=Botryotinia fuckeliana (strain B05.10) TaxID=332648 RepID=A0A384JJR8_BOTFB|nr:hypothetical protein BCIN_06g03050 [Botrytis cinerea B05.10]ATZ50826.1 hypothetical protein BCIN_06g03050 [Botrytis cinerea B05.10]